MDVIYYMQLQLIRGGAIEKSIEQIYSCITTPLTLEGIIIAVNWTLAPPCKYVMCVCFLTYMEAKLRMTKVDPSTAHSQSLLLFDLFEIEDY